MLEVNGVVILTSGSGDCSRVSTSLANSSIFFRSYSTTSSCPLGVRLYPPSPCKDRLPDSPTLSNHWDCFPLSTLVTWSFPSHLVNDSSGLHFDLGWCTLSLSLAGTRGPNLYRADLEAAVFLTNPPLRTLVLLALALHWSSAPIAHGWALAR